MQVLRKLLFPFSLLYGLVVYLRNLLYDTGIFSSRSFDTPTVCIGNLSTGGTGKTPMIEWILHQIGENRKVAVLSRGYKRRTRGFLRVNPSMNAEDAGDEPLQIAKKFKKAVVAVDGNRRRAITKLVESERPDLILLDDAFQHRRVKATINILLTAYSKLYVEDQYLPAGNLRDHTGQAKRADLIIVTKCPDDLGEEEQKRIEIKLKPIPGQTVLFSFLAYGERVRGLQADLELKSLADRDILLVTAIANPLPLLKKLDDSGINYRHRKFPDHHYFTEDEIRVFNASDMVLTTEKDFTRMGGRVPEAYYWPIEHRFLNDGKQQLLAQFKNL